MASGPVAKILTMPVKGPCKRCGIDTPADYCKDCRWVDPEFCADGRPAAQVRADRQAHNAWAADFSETMYRLSGISWQSREKRLAADARRAARRAQASISSS